MVNQHKFGKRIVIALGYYLIDKTDGIGHILSILQYITSSWPHFIPVRTDECLNSGPGTRVPGTRVLEDTCTVHVPACKTTFTTIDAKWSRPNNCAGSCQSLLTTQLSKLDTPCTPLLLWYCQYRYRYAATTMPKDAKK